MNKNVLIFAMILMSQMTFAQSSNPSQVYTTFETFNLGADTFKNSSDSLGFYHYGRFFPNKYNPQWDSWSGWALSSKTDSVTPGYLNQFSPITGSGIGFSKSFAVGNGNTFIKLDQSEEISGAYFTNSTYAYFDMKNGSGFSKKFGGISGKDPDYFLVKIQVFNQGIKQKETELILADFRSDDSQKDFILKDWKYVSFNDLNSPFLVDSISFVFESSDTGEYGINTPKYFIMDDFNAFNPFKFYNNSNNFNEIPENTFYNGSDLAGGFLAMHSFFPNRYNSRWNSWSGWALSKMNDQETKDFSNQYSPMNPKLGAAHFISFGAKNEIINPRYPADYEDHRHGFKLQAPYDLWQFEFNNTVYGYYAMKEGGQFNKKFGGESGNDPDYFRILIHFKGYADELLHTDTIYLADYRFENNEEDYIVKDWISYNNYQYLGGNLRYTTYKIEFELQSSDTGEYGLNNPAYFAMHGERDNFSVNKLKTSSIQVYPNPAQNVVHVQSQTPIQQIQVFGMDGRLWINQNVNTRQIAHEINVDELPNQLYFLQITTMEGVAVNKILIQK